MLWFAAAFFLWAATRVGASEYTVQALLGFARVLMAGGVMLFLASTVDTERRFLLLFRVYCAAAAVMAVMAVVATYHAFSVGRVLHASAELQVEGTMMLYNTPAGFNHAIVGMVPGYGLTPKHNLSLYLTAAIVFAFLLLLRAESRGGRTLLGALMVLYASVNHQAFSRLALAGLLLTTAGVLFLVRRWRARIPLALAALLALYTVGYACSRPFFPEHVGERESLTSSLTVVASESQYSANSLAGRVRIWKDAWRRIQQRLLLGRGPESLGLELAAGVPTAHNVVLSLWGDYGLVGVLLACGAVTAGGVRTHAVLWRSPEPDDGRWQLGAATTLTALLALFVYSFDLPIWSPHLWFMLGLLLAAVRLDEAKA
jgi:O-antigen ligase